MERIDLLTTIEVALLTLLPGDDFHLIAEWELEGILFALDNFEEIHDASIAFTSEGEGFLTVGLSILKYLEEGSDETEHFFELLKMHEYDGVAIMTRLGLRTVDAPDIMCSDEFADAFGLWRYIEAGYIVMDP